MLPKSPKMTERNYDPTKTSYDLQREMKTLRIPLPKKAFEGVSYSSVGSGATVGYQD